MNHQIIDYKGYKITHRTDEKSHCASIYKNEVLVKMVAGDIFVNGKTNVIDKSNKVIDGL